MPKGTDGGGCKCCGRPCCNLTKGLQTNLNLYAFGFAPLCNAAHLCPVILDNPVVIPLRGDGFSSAWGGEIPYPCLAGFYNPIGSLGANLYCGFTGINEWQLQIFWRIQGGTGSVGNDVVTLARPNDCTKLYFDSGQVGCGSLWACAGPNGGGLPIGPCRFVIF